MFKAWATALILTSVGTALCLPQVPRGVFPKAPSLFAVAVTTQTSRRKGLRDCFQAGNSTCTGVGGIGFFAGKGIELRCLPLDRALGSLSQVGKGRLGLQTVKLCRLSKVWKCSPNSSFTAFWRHYCGKRFSFLPLFYSPFLGSLFTVLGWCSGHIQEKRKKTPSYS